MSQATDVSNPQDALDDLEALQNHEDEKEAERNELEETRRKIERTAARGVGKMHLKVNYPREGVDDERVPFVRIPMQEATSILDRADELKEEGEAREFATFLTETLEEYSLDPEKNADHWGSELTMGDALGLVRNIAFGGAPPGK